MKVVINITLDLTLLSNILAVHRAYLVRARGVVWASSEFLFTHSIPLPSWMLEYIIVFLHQLGCSLSISG